ncbi:hypothetical protein C0J52_04560 [Blattella germanica]|nr:hypothetical protein C0J52_04560 [Blattella germanica]
MEIKNNYGTDCVGLFLNKRISQKTNFALVENQTLNPLDQEGDSWPELPGSHNSKSPIGSIRKFSHVVKHEAKEIKLQTRNRGWEQVNVSQMTHHGQPVNQSASVDYRETVSHLQGKDVSEQIEISCEKEKPLSRNKSLKKQKKLEKRNAKEEEARRNMVAPKDQRVRVVNQKVLEALLGNSVSFVNRHNVFPTLNETEFPTVEEAKKHRVKISDTAINEPSGASSVSTSRRKRKEPIHIDLVSLIKVDKLLKGFIPEKRNLALHKPQRPNFDPGRVQKRDIGSVHYSGNQLDASNPQRKRGKVKERPKKKKLSNLKIAILEGRALRKRLKAVTEYVDISKVDIDRVICLPVHSRKFREYCNNSLTPRLNEAVKMLLKDVVKFQDRQHQRDPIKAFAKRRYVSGFREVNKQLQLKKVKLVVIAPDLEVAKNKGVGFAGSLGGIDETVAELKAAAEQLEVVCLFALCRRQLGYITFKKVGISCIGICNYEGSENNYQEVLAALAEARASYQSKTSSKSEETSDVTGQVIASLLSKLTVNESPFLSAIERSSTSEEEH